MTDIKSQNDLNQPETHSTEVLLDTISKLETTTNKLELYKEIIKDEMVKNGERLEEIERLKKQLGEAVLGLKKIGYGRLIQPYITDAQSTALKTLDKIKELEK